MNIKQTYDDEAGIYEQTSRAVNIYFDESLDKLVSLLKLKKGMRVLDVCCGTGILTQKIFEKYPDVQIIGVDFSEGMMAVANERLAGYNFASFNSDICYEKRMKLLNGDFDVVVSSFGIHNIHGFKNKEKGIKNVVSLLKNGGKYYTCDLLKGDTKEIEEQWQNFQYQWLLKTYEVAQAEAWMRMLKEEDDKETYDKNKQLLELAGLENIEKVWQKEFLAIWTGTKIKKED